MFIQERSTHEKRQNEFSCGAWVGFFTAALRDVRRQLLTRGSNASATSSSGTEGAQAAEPVNAPKKSPASGGEQFIPLPTFRVGAYASSGIPVWGGFIDYLTYINEAEGGSTA